MKWEVGQTVMVQSRTWANINKPGGCAKITKVHTVDDGSYVEGIDVKYVVGGGREKNLDPAIVSPYETLERGGRKRRGRDFLMKREEDVIAERKSRVRKQPVTTEKPRDVVVAAEASGKENRSSLRSSPTCSTPEKPKVTRKPQKVTPIPRMVITDRQIDDISPMPEDRWSTERFSEKRDRIVSRGRLFEGMTKKKPISAQSACFAPGIGGKPRSRTNPESEQDGVSKSQNYTSTASNSVPLKKQPRMKQSTSSLSDKQLGKRKMSTCRVHKKPNLGSSRSGSKPLGAVAKAKSRYNPPSTSFSRVTSAYDNKKSSSIEPNRKPLFDVYRLEVQKARDFMEEMVGHRDDDDLGGLGESSTKERSGFFTTKSRYDEFLSHLNNVWLKIDEEEVSEETFKEVYHEVSSKLFTPEQLDSHIQTWCDEGKEVMKSDGMLYRIQ